MNQPDTRFLGETSITYALLIVAIVLTINPYFARTWDVVTFIDAAESSRDGGSFFDLYVRSRANRPWPYAYPANADSFLGLVPRISFSTFRSS